MIQEVILFDSEKLDPLTGYSSEGKLDIEKTVKATGLITLITKTVNHLKCLNLFASNEIISLKTGGNTFSFKITNNIIISVRGTSEKENKKIIDEIINSKIENFW